MVVMLDKHSDSSLVETWMSKSAQMLADLSVKCLVVKWVVRSEGNKVEGSAAR